jgi:oxalate decarboxylase
MYFAGFRVARPPAGNPLQVLATNFSKPESLFKKFPHGDVFISPQ